MLVLTRKENEVIMIGGDIRLTLISIDGDKVKLGIHAPRSVRIFREELMNATRELNKQALNAPTITFDLRNCSKTNPQEPV